MSKCFDIKKPKNAWKSSNGRIKTGWYFCASGTVFAYFVNTVSFGFFALFEFHNAHSVAHALHTSNWIPEIAFKKIEKHRVGLHYRGPVISVSAL